MRARIYRTMALFAVTWAAGVTSSAAVAAAAPAVQKTGLPPLTGPYQVGTTDFMWVDKNRPELTTKNPDDFRHILIKVWYPASPAKGAKLAPYIPNFNEFSAETKKELVRAQTALSRSYLDAPILASEQSFPILIYNHGGAWSRFTSNFVNE